MRLHTYSRNKHIDLFSRTSAVEKKAILRSKKPLINSRERTGQSGGFLTSISSNRAMWRVWHCCLKMKMKRNHRKLGFNKYGIFPDDMKYADGAYADAVWNVLRLARNWRQEVNGIFYERQEKRGVFRGIRENGYCSHPFFF